MNPIKQLRTILLTLLLFSTGLSLHSQTKISGIVTDSLNNPVPFATVYLSKTTIGVYTDNQGSYSITIPQKGVYEMITSCVGYLSDVKPIQAEGKDLVISVKLRINSVLINEVTVKAKDKNRIKNNSQFLKLFLGESMNAQNCRITNEEDLRLYKDDQNNIARGYSVKPLRIENKALGYVVLYDLLNFSYNQKTKILNFTGNQYFQPIKGTSKKTKRWETNRLTAYYGSRMHFIRAIVSDSLERENYKIYECTINNTTDEYTIVKPVQEKYLKFTSNPNFTTLFYNKPLLICYKDNHPELSHSLMGFDPQVHNSTIVFSDAVKVFKNGAFDNPHAIIWGGEMANERVADMLPFDFKPYGKTVEKADTSKFTTQINTYLTSQQNRRSPDQVFVHTDRNRYVPGDTLFFQAYVKNPFTGIFETNSVSMYALLFNPHHVVVDSARFKIEGATSSGWMAIPTNAAAGTYRFVAFTGKMQNFDPQDAFQLDISVAAMENDPEKMEVTFDKKNDPSTGMIEATIKITDSKGLPISKQKLNYQLVSNHNVWDSEVTTTNNQGESFIRFSFSDTLTSQPYLQIIADNKSDKESIKKVFPIPFEDKFLDVKILPEGGTLIKGVRQRIGFNATNRKGEPVPIEGYLKNRYGNIIDSIKSGPYGPGIIVCKPEPGMYLKLSKGTFKNTTWQFPGFSKSDLCLSVVPISNRSFAVEIQSANYHGEPVFLAGTMNTSQFFSKEVVLTKKQRFIIETDELPFGIAQITLFDKDKRAIAERLLYVNIDKRLIFNIKPDSSLYSSRQETELSISVTDGLGHPQKGVFSMSVVDSLSGYNPELFIPGIEYACTFHPYLSGNLPEKVLQKGIENLTDEQRDIVLMVYGWKKYSWDLNPTKSSDKIQFTNYDLMDIKLISGQKSQRSNRKLNLFSMEGPSVMPLKTNKEGELTVLLDSLPKITRMVTLMDDPKNKNKTMGARLQIPSNPSYFKSTRFFTALPKLTLNAQTTHMSDTTISFTDKTIAISKVTIVGKKKSEKGYHNAYEELYKGLNVKTIDDKSLKESSTLLTALRRITNIDTDKASNIEKVFLLQKTSIFAARVPALFVLDGMPLYTNGYERVETIPTNEIASLTILKSQSGYTMYWEPAKGGVIFVNTRAKISPQSKYQTYRSIKNSLDMMQVPIQIYRPTIEFYNPTKAEADTNPIVQNRPTLYWNPEIYFDSKAPVKLNYPNLSKGGSVMITINGVSFSNLSGTGKAGYQVRK